MALTFPTLSALADAPFDEIIDVRSPAEFAEDHVPGAISLPVMSNAERARVGTIYVQESRFVARKLGAAIVARNVAAHIDAHFTHKPTGYRPLVYCWRGGQRSGAMATILGQIGWRVETVDGGYRSYRRLVADRLYNRPLGLNLVLLDGNTGCAKTDLLHLLAARGVQMIDLEGLAHHRGSVFGGYADAPQPAQKGFESALAQAIEALDPARPVVVEAESNKIGSVLLPPTLWEAMRAAPRVEVRAAIAERARYLTGRYADIVADPDRLTDLIGRLGRLHPKDRIEEWHALGVAGDHAALAESLMVHHYDPTYQRSRGRWPGAVVALEVRSLDAQGLATAADRLAPMVAEAGARL
ncbi:MAG: tRNA 2-selenouridine(34) synthase MnmH [Pseudomonadota bacterium]